MGWEGKCVLCTGNVVGNERLNMCVNVADCNRYSHMECLEKQGECSKLSPRGLCVCVHVCLKACM